MTNNKLIPPGPIRKEKIARIKDAMTLKSLEGKYPHVWICPVCLSLLPEGQKPHSAVCNCIKKQKYVFIGKKMLKLIEEQQDINYYLTHETYNFDDFMADLEDVWKTKLKGGQNDK